jgi:Ca2+-binding EF-hand superfamily protein
MHVEARYRGKTRYYPGVIKRANRDGTFDIDYDDGEKETYVEANLVRALDDGFGDSRRDRDNSRDRERPRRARDDDSPPRPADGVTLIARALRDQLWEWARGFSKGGGKTREALRKVFRAIDKADSGSVPRAEMAALLVKKMKLRVSAAEVDLLMDCMDVDGSGLISYDEFVDFCCHQPEGRELGVLHSILASAVRRSGHDLLHLCQRYDDKKRGTLKAADLKKVLAKVGALDGGLRSSDVAEVVSRFAYGLNKDDVDYDLLVSLAPCTDMFL